MIRTLPLFIGIAPLVAVTVAYRLNVDAGILPSCIPFVEGCVSISATGRYAPGSLMFRAVLLPQAALLGLLWWVAAGWLRAQDVAAGKARVVLTCGLVAAVALVVYVTFLGTTQPFYEFMRRFGIYFYFLGTALAQLLLAWYLPRSRLRQAMLLLIALPLLLGILNLVQKAILAEPDALENSIEWLAALMMQLWFPLLFIAWRRDRVTLKVETDSTSVRL